MTWLFSLVSLVLEVVFPPRCAACRSPLSRDDSFCAVCCATLVSGTDQACAMCGLVWLDPPPGGGRHLCGACQREPPPYRRARAAYAYGAALQQAIRAWKNQPDEALGRPLGRALAAARDRLELPLGEATLVVPVPSTPRALAQRGFNPAAALARPLARSLRARYAPTALDFAKLPASSRGLGRHARARRMRGVFRARASVVSGRDVLLVDDVMTTGSTVSSAAQACLAVGARSVEVVVLARVPG